MIVLSPASTFLYPSFGKMVNTPPPPDLVDNPRTSLFAFNPIASDYAGVLMIFSYLDFDT